MRTKRLKRILKKRKKICRHLLTFISLFFILFSLIPETSLAQESPQVIINEVLANPEDESTQEFIELYNKSDQPVDIYQFPITDLADTNDFIEDYTEVHNWGLEGTIIPSGGFALIVDPDYDGYLNDYLDENVDPENVIMVTNGQDSTLGNGLGNSAETLTIGEDTWRWTEDSGEGISWELKDPENNHREILKNKNDSYTPGKINSYLDLYIETRIKGSSSWTNKSSFPQSSILEFNASYYQDITDYTWYLPEGVISNNANPEYSFSNTGEYEIYLEVTTVEQNLIDTYINIEIIPNIKINEFLPDPEKDWNNNGVIAESDDEWFEIYNPSEEDYILIDWQLCDSTSCSLIANQVIGAKSYIVIYRKDLDISLNNNGDIVKLLDSNSNEFDEVTYTSSITDQSWSRTKDGEGHWVQDYDITPGETNKPKPIIIYPDHILITEIYPSPYPDEEEWIELFNYGDSTIILEDWVLKDNTASQKLIDLTIEPLSYLVISSRSLKLTLNNSGEIITLVNPTNRIVDNFEYISTKSGISNIRIFDKNKYFQSPIKQTQVVTKGEQNIYIDPLDIFYGVEIIDIVKAKNLQIGSEVSVKGTITVEEGKLGSKVFYIQDKTAGIQIYLSDSNLFDGLRLNDQIQILGELKVSNEEFRIYVKDKNAIKVISNNNKIDPSQISTGKNLEENEGKLVLAIGKITKTSGKTFYIDDGSGSLKISIKSSTGIETPKKKKGQYAGVIGILSQYGVDSEGNPNYRLLPFDSKNITISDTLLTAGQVLAATGNDLNIQFLSAFLLVVSCLLYFRHRIKSGVTSRTFVSNRVLDTRLEPVVTVKTYCSHAALDAVSNVFIKP